MLRRCGLLILLLASGAWGAADRTGRLGLPLGTDARYNEAMGIIDFAFGTIQTNGIDVTASYTWTGVHHFTGTLGIPHSASLPGTCSVGDTYQNTGAAASQQFFLCTAPNIWTGQAGGGTVTGLSGDTGGTTTGAAPTLAGGSGIRTVRTGDTVFVQTDTTEAAAISTLNYGACGGGNAGKETFNGKDILYCDGEVVPTNRRTLSMNNAFPVNNRSLVYFNDAGNSLSVTESAGCLDSGDANSPGIDCNASGVDGGVISIKEKISFGTDVFGFHIPAGLNIPTNLMDVDASAKVSGAALLSNASVTNTQLATAQGYGPWSYVDLSETAPGAPGAGNQRVYTKAGSGVCAKDSGGVERCGGGGGGGSSGGYTSAFGTGMLLATGTNTVFGGLGLPVDPTEGRVQAPMPTGTFRNLRCVSHVATGGSGVAITLRSGTCGSQADSTLTTTVTGANTTATDTTHTLDVTAGQCVDVKYVSTATTTAPAVTCTVDFSGSTFLTLGSGMLLPAGTATVYAGAGSMADPTEGVVQIPSPTATYGNLRCALSVATGGGSVTARFRTGPCGALVDAAMLVTLTTTSVGTDPSTVAVTGGNCLSVRLSTSATVTPTAVACSLERTQ